jgi:light-regulated signal transduction histidine kinase (bacteriophytochrome)
MGNSARITTQPYEIGQGSELRRVRAELEQRTTALEHSRKQLKELASSVSHDLSQPLTTIAGFADLLARRYEGTLDSDGEEFLAFILKGVDRMQTMIEDLVSYLRTAEDEPPETTVDCSRLLSRVVDSLSEAIARADASLIAEPLPAVRGDAVQLGQVFQQLISNSLKFNDSESPQIFVSAETDDDGVCFSVADNGVGVEASQAERAFELFQRFESSRPGNGMGLAICRKIVERHGGRLWVEPNDEGGSIFRFTIPERDPR